MSCPAPLVAVAFAAVGTAVVTVPGSDRFAEEEEVLMALVSPMSCFHPGLMRSMSMWTSALAWMKGTQRTKVRSRRLNWTRCRWRRCLTGGLVEGHGSDGIYEALDRDEKALVVHGTLRRAV
jgi:hypothetical protein